MSEIDEAIEIASQDHFKLWEAARAELARPRAIEATARAFISACENSGGRDDVTPEYSALKALLEKTK